MKAWYHSKCSSSFRTEFRTSILLVCLLVTGFAAAPPAAAQDDGFGVQGVVVDATDNNPLPGVNIVEVGTTNGTTTNSEGRFILTVAGPEAQLAVSYVGFIQQTIDVNGRNDLVITLEEDTAAMEEVVVTAFGIERKEKSVGYAVSEISGENLREARETNVANALSGKMAGVVVSKPASGPAGSSRVVIRGNNSLEGSNQPLYVVDGVPIDNSNLGSAGEYGGVDRGDGISSINPDDVENISVLKGPAAAALYGTRAQNGVILITTKTGRAGGAGLGVEYSSNVTFEDALVGFTDYQEVYGQGQRGQKPTSAIEALETGQLSWGAPLDGSEVIQFDGVARPYSLVDNKLDAFYETGLNTTNTLALTGGVGQTTFRFSGSYLNSQSIVPNSGMDRYTLTLRGTSEFGRLSADVKANYVREEVDNRTRLSDSPGNPNYTIAVLPPNVDPESMKPGHVPGNELQELQFRQDIFGTNSYWAANYFVNDDSENRIIGFARLRYQLLDWLAVQGRVGQDWYNTRATSVTPYGTAYRPLGDMSELEATVLERNWDFLFTADKALTPAVGLSAALGGNRLDSRFEQIGLSGSEFSIPGLQTISNLANQTNSYGFSRKRINSLYGSAELSYGDYLFLTATGRNDWSSTLPSDNNSYFYPSISGSFVFSDAFTVPSWWSFGKVRASWAEVGGDTDPYRLSLTYNLLNVTHQGQPLGVISQTSIPLADLKPSSTVGVEFGFNTRFFDNRLGLDFTWYNQRTTDQILGTTVVESTGFSSKVINAGEMKNTGVELLLNLTPVRTSNVRWDVDFNFARNNNEVVELTEGLESLNLAPARSFTAWVVAQVGEPFSTIRGYTYERDTNGDIVLDDAGLPVQGPLDVLGVGIPDWTSGLINTVRYKNLSLSALVHISWGGEIFSGTNQQAYSAGLHKNTLVGRAECEAAGYDANDGNGCWVPPGVVNPPRDDEGNIIGSGTPNTTPTFPETYYGAVASRIAEEFVYDASYIKLRELQLSYRLPTSWLRRSPIRLATVSLVGRNLWLIHSKVPNVDPESNYNNTNAQGIEWAGVPQTRSFGFNLNIRL